MLFPTIFREYFKNVLNANWLLLKKDQNDTPGLFSKFWRFIKTLTKDYYHFQLLSCLVWINYGDNQYLPWQIPQHSQQGEETWAWGGHYSTWQRRRWRGKRPCQLEEWHQHPGIARIKEIFSYFSLISIQNKMLTFLKIPFCQHSITVWLCAK